ncbi:hypothetical protein [Acidiphilium iwatense]|uniref:hypothetical protein n=1 Tax=Acidiphilium iwatense TaxID=768198 RepID=UPI001F2436A2|nr:hypothetical protein [Acidiphilium iwatense]
MSLLLLGLDEIGSGVIPPQVVESFNGRELAPNAITLGLPQARWTSPLNSTGLAKQPVSDAV